MTSSSSSVMIVEDEPLIRRGLQLFLQNKGLHVIDMVDNGEEAIKKTLELHPDVVLMDIKLIGLDGISAARQIKQLDTRQRVLMLTASDYDDDIFASLDAGADGYVLKTAFADSLELAIKTVQSGTVWLDPQIAQRILRFAIKSSNTKSASLSNHEKSILQDVANSTCVDGTCFVQPGFLENLKRFRQQANN